jgi:hypothetical protein
MTTAGPRVLVQKVYAIDFDRIYHALLASHDPRIRKEDWRQLFRQHWDTPEDYYGYMLIDNEEVVGFLGTVFSKRRIHGKEFKFCNLTSWIVKPEHRNKSLFLLFPLLKLTDYTFTNLTAQEHVAEIHRQLGFSEIGSGAQILLPLPRLVFGNKIKFQIIFNHDQVRDNLKGDDFTIFHDHLKFKCKHILLKSEIDHCYIIASKVIKKRLPILYIHYISNLSCFLSLIHRAAFKILLYCQAVVLLIEDRFLKGRRLRGAIGFTLPQFKLYKSPTLQDVDIDNLYSERILLNY